MSGLRWIERLWTNDVETGASSAYPDVRPLDLALDPHAAYAAALEAARAMPRWRIITVDPAGRRLRAEAWTRMMKFVDDVIVWVEPAADGSRVHARSASRVGITDFGTNARRLRAYLRRVEERAGG